MRRKKILNPKYKSKLQNICLVFFPEYKKVRVSKDGSVMFSKRTRTKIPRTLKYSHNYLMDYVLPFKLTMFKYNNEQFIGAVFDLRTSKLLKGVNIVDFYHEEILKLKLSHDIHDVVVRTHEDYFVDGERSRSTVYYLLDGEMYRVSDYFRKVIERPLGLAKRNYYELVGFGIVTLAIILFVA